MNIIPWRRRETALPSMFDIDDLLIMLAGWGACSETCCPGDLDGNLLINIDDLLMLLSNWG